METTPNAAVEERHRVTPDTMIYKIMPRTSWAAALAAGTIDVAASADDARDGYIHLSAAHQAAETARRYFAGRGDLVLAAWCCGDLGAELKWEPSRGGDLFPHHYGPLPVKLARWVRPLALRDDGIPDIAAALAA